VLEQPYRSTSTATRRTLTHRGPRGVGVRRASVDRFVGSALDAQPWGTLHVVVALVLVLAASAAIVATATAVGERVLVNVRVRRLMRELELASTFPVVE
jgi:hypothetical protein